MQNICKVMQTLYRTTRAKLRTVNIWSCICQAEVEYLSRSDRGFRRRHQRLSTTNSKGVRQGLEHRQFRRR